MTVLGCSGHQAIPEEAAQFVDDGLTEAVRAFAQRDLVGVCSLAAGADQLFARIVLRAGGKLQVVVPSANYESTFDHDGRVAYADLLSLAHHVETLGFDDPSEEAFRAAGYRVAELCDVLVAVWDGQPAKGKGGTADVVEHARRLGRPVEVVWPEGVARN